MGGFQAVASGLGEGGEQLGTGINNAEQMALKLRQQSHLENVDAQHIALAQALQKQQYDIANQQHELMRQQILQNGWAHVGTVKEGEQYFQVFQNPRMPQGQQNMKLPYNGVPPDSPESLVGYYKTLRGMTNESGNPMFTDEQAKKIAFKMPNLYKEGPAGIVQGFREDAAEQAENGIKSIRIPGLGSFDITTPKGQADYAQAVLSTIHPGGLYRALNGGAGANKDMTGWTAGELREYKPLEEKARRSEELLKSLAVAQMNMTFDPKQQESIRQQLLEQTASIWKEPEEKYSEISNRHHAPIAFQVPAGAPPATGLKDGTPLNDSRGRVVARAKDGKWGPP